MTTAVVTTSYPDGPGDYAGHFVRADARLLAETGRVVVVAPGSWVDPDERRLEVVRLGSDRAFGAPGVAARVRAHPALVRDVGAFVLRARRALRAIRPDRIVAHWLIPSAWPIAAAVDVPLSVVVHGGDARLLLALPRPARRWLVESLLDRGATFRFVSRDLLDRVARATTERVRDHAAVAPSALDVSGAPGRAAARGALGLRSERRIAVIVGRLIERKRIAVALDAATSIGGLDVVVVGDGPEREALALAHPRVRFTGSVARDQALAWIAAADVLISASREEGAPTVIREARALGVPVVAVAAGDLQEWAARDPGISLAVGEGR